jgi:hypothetical protein
MSGRRSHFGASCHEARNVELIASRNLHVERLIVRMPKLKRDQFTWPDDWTQRQVKVP